MKQKTLLDLGKIPPQAIDLEEAVLGGCLIEQDAYDEVAEIITKPEVFYRDAHQQIFRAIQNLSTKAIGIDVKTVAEELRVMGKLDEIGGPFFIVELAKTITSTANIKYHARIIVDKFLKREIIRIGSELSVKGFDDSVDIVDIINYNEKGLIDLVNNIGEKEAIHISSLSRKNMELIERLMKGEEKLIGISSGNKKLDKLIFGFRKTDLVTIAARPSIGKTALALQFAYDIAVNQKIPVMFFSLESGAEQLELRLKIQSSEVDGVKVFTGDLDNTEKAEIDQATTELENSKLYIDDTANLNVLELRRRIKKSIKQHGVEIVFIDYLQLMSGVEKFRAGSREAEVSEISRALKGCAKDFDIPIIALAQLNRSVEATAEQKPKLSNLRESGSIEQDSDIVIFIYRPWQVGIKQDAEGATTFGKAEFIIAKHRNGPTGVIKMGFKEECVKFIPESRFDFEETTAADPFEEQSDLPF